MSNRIRCSCQRCTIRALMGPAILITIGVLFLLSETRGGYLDFSNTYPVILIVIGAVSLASALSSSEGHGSSSGMPMSPGRGPTQQAPGSSSIAPGQGQQ